MILDVIVILYDDTIKFRWLDIWTVLGLSSIQGWNHWVVGGLIFKKVNYLLEYSRFLRHQLALTSFPGDCKLVGGLEHFLFFHVSGIIIPIDELIFFRGVGTPPTSKSLAFSGDVFLKQRQPATRMYSFPTWDSLIDAGMQEAELAPSRYSPHKWPLSSASVY